MFVNFQKDYDNVPSIKLWEVLQVININHTRCLDNEI